MAIAIADFATYPNYTDPAGRALKEYIKLSAHVGYQNFEEGIFEKTELELHICSEEELEF